MSPIANPTYLLPPLLAAAAAIALAIPVARRALQNGPHRYFALFLLAISAWGLLAFAMRASPDEAHALIWEDLVVLAALASTPAFFFFTRTYSRRPITRMALLLGAVFLIAALVLDVFGQLVAGVRTESYGFAPVFHPAFYFVALAGYAWVVLGIWTLYQTYRSATDYEERNRLLYMLTGAAFPVVGTVIDLFPFVYPAKPTP